MHRSTRRHKGGRLRTVVPVHERISRNHDARDTLDTCRRSRGDVGEGASHGYHPYRGGRYDNSDVQSLSPSLSGPQAFG